MTNNIDTTDQLDSDFQNQQSSKDNSQIGEVNKQDTNDDQSKKRKTESNLEKIKGFEKLTPVKLLPEEMSGYTEALDFVFKLENDKDLLNIAISGPYASGKTSIIDSYIEDKKINTLKVSLAYFEPNDLYNNINEDNNPEDIKDKLRKENSQRARELMLERKILNQLIHQVDTDKIPFTEFRVKHEPKKKEITAWAIIITLLIFFFYYIQRDWFEQLFDQSSILLYIIWATAFISIFFILYELIKVQKRKSIIQRLKIFETELDISGNKKDESYFDNYLDEIIYILENAKVKAIIFEDIDRYEDNLILARLRELNVIYNRKQQDYQKRIKFIYLIKDEMFESKDRTKFFDFIIPIVPVIDSANSFSKINSIFESLDINKDFKDSTFLYELSLYLDDIRLIKNICNEYNIYRHKLKLFDEKITWLTPEKLLAVITYKNIFPKDFAETRLGYGQGVLHRVVESFKEIELEFKEQKLKKINKEVEQVNKNIDKLENDCLNNMAELVCLFIKIPYGNYIFKNSSGEIYRREDVCYRDYIKAIMELNYHVYNNIAGDQLLSPVDLKKNFDDLDKCEEYKERKVYLIENKEQLLTDYKNHLQELEKEKLMLSIGWKISEIIKEEEFIGGNIDTLFQKHWQSNNPLNKDKFFEREYQQLESSPYFSILKYFIRRGFIDEYYTDYMSFFYEGGLHRNDTEFLRHIAEHRTSHWELKLYNPEILVSARLREENFNTIHILNFTLFDFLVSKRHEFLAVFIRTLKEHKEGVQFINEYLAQQDSISLSLLNKELINQRIKLKDFINEVNQIWPLYWTKTSFDKKYYLYISFQSVNEKILKLMNEGGELVKFINSNKEFLDLDSKQSWAVNLKHIENFFQQLSIELVDFENPMQVLLQLVYDNWFYKFSLANIDYMLINICHKEIDKAYYLQTIYSLESEPLYEYCLCNIEELMHLLINIKPLNFEDDEDTFVKILNNQDISHSNKTNYLDRSQKIIKELSSIKDKEIWDTLLEKNKVHFSANNIIFYYLNYDPSSKDIVIAKKEFINFINSSTNIIAPEDIWSIWKYDTDEEKAEANLFFERLITVEDIRNEKYEMIVRWLGHINWRFYNFSKDNLSKEKVSILIKYGVIRLTEKQDVDFLRKNYPDNIIEFLVKNIDEYTKRLQTKALELLTLPEKKRSSLFQEGELETLLSSDISDDNKLGLIVLTNMTISLKNLKISEQVKELILENKFDRNDISFITSAECYRTSSDNNKEKIAQLCIKYLDDVFKLSVMAYDLLVNLLSTDKLEIEKKYQLLANILSKLNANQAYECFCILEDCPSPEQKEKREFSKVFKGKRPTFEYTASNIKIAEKIESKNWGSISEKNEEERTFRINGKSLVKDDKTLSVRNPTSNP